MGTILKRIILYGGGGLLLMAAALSLWISSHEETLVRMVVTELNKQLTGHLDYTKSSLSIWKHFPEASLSFEEVRLRGSLPLNKSDSNLLEIKRLSFSLSPLDLWNKKYHVHSLELEGGAIHLLIDKNGKGNYNILKDKPRKAEKTKDTTNFRLALEKVILRDVQLSFISVPTKTRIGTHIAETRLSGNFAADSFRLSNTGTFDDFLLRIDHVNYINRKKVYLNTELQVNLLTNRYTIGKTDLRIARAQFAVSGFVENKKSGIFSDIQLSIRETNLNNVATLLPEIYLKRIEKYRLDGLLFFRLNIRGLSNAKTNPAIGAIFSVRQGVFHIKDKELSLSNLAFTGSFTNGRRHNQSTTTLKIDNLRGKLRNKDLSAQFLLGNFDDPFLNLQLISNFNLKDVQEFVSFPAIEKLSGDVFVDASFSGRLADLKQARTASRIRLSGEMKLEGVEVRPQGSKISYSDLSGEFRFDGTNLIFNKLTGKAGSSDFRLNGSFGNVAGFLFLDHQTLDFSGSLKSEKLLVDEFITDKNAAGDKKDTSAASFSFPAFITGSVRLEVGTLQYKKLRLEQLRASTSIMDNSVAINISSARAFDGKVSGNLRVNNIHTGKYFSAMHLVMNAVDINRLFGEMDNFSQTFITDKNIHGRLSTTLDYESSWKPNLDVDLKTVVSNADITWDKGELTNMESLVSLGKFMHKKGMDHLYFKQMHNTISIASGKILIPEMEIKSSVVNMSLSGTHTFDNVLDYHIKANGSQLLRGKKEDYDTEFGRVKVDEERGANIYIYMRGPADKLKIGYDTDGLKTGLKKEIAEQKAQIRAIFGKKSSAEGVPEDKAVQKTNGSGGYTLEGFDDKKQVDPAIEAQKKKTAEKKKKESEKDKHYDLKWDE